MALLIELSPVLEEDLAALAAEAGVSATEWATFSLQLVANLIREGRSVPPRNVFEAYLRERGFDADRLADVLGRSTDVIPDEGQTAPGSRLSDVASVMGKYAYLGGGSEEFMREKRLAIEREDRGR